MTQTDPQSPPVLMVAAPWDWSFAFMATHFGWKAGIAIFVSTLGYFLLFRQELTALETTAAVTTVDDGDQPPATPWWRCPTASTR